MLKVLFPFFGQGVTHGDPFLYATFADVIRDGAHALLGRRETWKPAMFPADNWARDETGQAPLRQEPSDFSASGYLSVHLPSDSPLRADIGLLPLDNFR